MKICIIGLGNVGLPTARRSAQIGFDTHGHDVREEPVQKALELGLKATTLWHKLPIIDVFLICVGNTSNEVQTVCEEINRRPQKPVLVVIESTLRPSTTRKIWEDIFNKDVHMAHVPHRFWSHDPEKRGIVVPRVAGATSTKAEIITNDIYQKLGIRLRWLSLEGAELVKITENTKRFIDIAFAEELAMLCHSLDIDYREVHEGVNTHFAHTLLEAREGIGGNCLTLATNIITDLSFHLPIINAAKAEDKRYKDWLKENEQ
ncbi:MAG: NAD(P)-binding domain-containing protein [Planctomycetota bacterium]|jgi:nucleotide sugar dehydrogenase